MGASTEVGQAGLRQPTSQRPGGQSRTPAWQRWCQVAREVSGGLAVQVLCVAELLSEGTEL